MKSTVVFTPNVINTLNALPENERLSIACALVGEMIFGQDAMGALNSVEKMLYTMIRYNVRQDSERFSSASARTA